VEGKGREGKGREGKGREGKGRDTRGRGLGVGGWGQGWVEDMCGLEYAGTVWVGVIRGTRAVADEHGAKDPLRFIFFNFKTPRRCLKCLTPFASSWKQSPIA